MGNGLWRFRFRRHAPPRAQSQGLRRNIPAGPGTTRREAFCLGCGFCFVCLLGHARNFLGSLGM